MATKAQAGESFAEEDRRFHLLLMERVDNRLFGELVEAFGKIQTKVQPHLGVAPGADMMASARAHGTLVGAARQGDVAAYRTAMRGALAALVRAFWRGVGRRW